MARPLRLEFPGAIYHITSRGNACNDVFLDDRDRELFLKILAETVERYNWLCHGYCLMDNHYHLLVETLDPSLSIGMRQLNGVYTQSFNRQHSRVGHVFQGRFKSIIVEKGTHLLELSRYIVLNPVKARIVEKPDQWQWSSYCETAGIKKNKSFLNTGWILGQFSGIPSKARKQYIEFVNQMLGENETNPWQDLHGQILLGGSKFVAEMQNKLSEKQAIAEIPRVQRYAGRPMLDEIFSEVANKEVRNRKILSAHVEHGYTLQEVAETLRIHYTTVSRIVKQQREKIL